MSSVTKVSNGWRARWRTPDGKSRSKTFVRKIDAEKHLTGTDHTKLRGAYVDPGAGRITFRTYGEQWRAVQVHRPSTAVQLETNLRRHVYPTLGDRPIGEVLEPSTVELVYRYVVAIFRAAAADRVISQNPAIGTRLPRAEPRRVEPLEAEVVQAIIDTVPDRYRALVVLAAGTGLRQGECFGLTLDRVDFLRRQITVDRQLVLLPGSGPVFGAPKTQASYRIVPLPAVVLDTLAAHLARYPVGLDGFLFTNHAGDPIRRTRFSDVWPSCSEGFRSARTHRISLPEALLRLAADPTRGVGQGRAGPPWPCQRSRDARHVLASLARQRGPDARRCRRSARTSCVTYVSQRGGRNLKLLVKPVVVASRPIGGVLYAGSGKPARRGGHPSMRPTWGHWAGSPSHIWPCSGWGLPSRPGHPGRWCALTAPFHPYLCTANRAIGGLFSVALSFGSPRLAVSQHPALWSPDLPQRDAGRSIPSSSRGHPADSPRRQSPMPTAADVRDAEHQVLPTRQPPTRDSVSRYNALGQQLTR